MSVALGALETQLLAYCQMRGRLAVRSEEVSEALGLTPTQTRELLSRLSRRGLIARVRRGLYLVPSRIPPGGRWSPNEFLALETLLHGSTRAEPIVLFVLFQRLSDPRPAFKGHNLSATVAACLAAANSTVL